MSGPTPIDPRGLNGAVGAREGVLASAAERAARSDLLYRSWALECTRARGWAEEKILILAEPSAETPALVDAVLKSGIEHIVCGFLPDEVDWAEPGWYDTLAFFAEHFEFAPLLLATPVDPTEHPETAAVVAVCDRPDGTVEALASGCANATGRAVEVLLTGTAPPSTCAAAVAGAALIVNASEGWALGFAIDELAARRGIPVVRLRNPGYSPLRYALLDLDPPPATADDVLRVRPLLTAGRWTDPAAREPGPAESMFSGAVAGERWRTIFAPDQHAKFWAGADLARLNALRADEPDRWLNRPVGWAAAAAACDSPFFPAGSRDRLFKILVRWVSSEQKVHLAGAVRDAALGRWVRLQPDWLSFYRESANDVQTARQAVTRWLSFGAAWCQSETPALPMIREAAWALERNSDASVGLELAVCWGSEWAKVPTVAVKSRTIEPLWRAICAEVFLSRVDDLKMQDRDALSLLLDEEAVWFSSMGVAAPIVRVLGCLSLGRLASAGRAWKTALRYAGCSSAFGIASVFRAAFPTKSELKDWLAACARCEPPTSESVVLTVVDAWSRRRGWKARRRLPDPTVMAEVSAIHRLLDQAVRNTPSSVQLTSMLARFAGLAGAPLESRAAIGAIAQMDRNRAADVALRTALDLWLRGATDEARDIVWAFRDVEAPMLVFLRAVILQLSGLVDDAEVVLDVLANNAREFFVNQTTADGRWPWTAAVFKSAGCLEESTRLAAIAIKSAPDCAALIGDILPGGGPLAAGWRRLFPNSAGGGAV